MATNEALIIKHENVMYIVFPAFTVSIQVAFPHAHWPVQEKAALSYKNIHAVPKPETTVNRKHSARQWVSLSCQEVASYLCQAIGFSSMTGVSVGHAHCS